MAQYQLGQGVSEATVRHSLGRPLVSRSPSFASQEGASCHTGRSLQRAHRTSGTDEAVDDSRTSLISCVVALHNFLQAGAYLLARSSASCLATGTHTDPQGEEVAFHLPYSVHLLHSWHHSSYCADRSENQVPHRRYHLHNHNGSVVVLHLLHIRSSSLTGSYSHRADAFVLHFPDESVLRE